MFTQLLSLLFGFLPQLPLQYRSAPFVLAKRFEVLTRQTVKLHQQAVNSFLQGIQSQPLPPIIDSLLVLTPYPVKFHQPLKCRDLLTAKVLLHQ